MWQWGFGDRFQICPQSPLRNSLLEKELQGFPGTAAEIGKKLPVIKEVTA